MISQWKNCWVFTQRWQLAYQTYFVCLFKKKQKKNIFFIFGIFVYWTSSPYYWSLHDNWYILMILSYPILSYLILSETQTPLWWTLPTADLLTWSTLWSMDNEFGEKNKLFKNVVCDTQNFKYFSMTLALRHQKAVGYQLDCSSLYRLPLYQGAFRKHLLRKFLIHQQFLLHPLSVLMELVTKQTLFYQLAHAQVFLKLTKLFRSLLWAQKSCSCVKPWQYGTLNIFALMNLI